jgi:hypothetical protein
MHGIKYHLQQYCINDLPLCALKEVNRPAEYHNRLFTASSLLLSIFLGSVVIVLTTLALEVCAQTADSRHATSEWA